MLGKIECREIAIRKVRGGVDFYNIVDMLYWSSSKSSHYRDRWGSSETLNPKIPSAIADAAAHADNSYSLKSRVYMPEINCFD